MKRRFQLPVFRTIFALLFLTTGIFKGQSVDVPDGIHSMDGIFDTLYDASGQKYTLADLSIYSTKPLGRHNTVNGVPTQTCQSGYFTLYFAPGSIFTNSLSAQTVLCKIFEDISTLIGSSCPAGAIKIYCTDTPNGVTARGVAVPFMSMPSNPISPNQGILDNQVYNYLVSGQDPYASLPLIFSSNSFYYHGAMQMNPTTNWNFNLATTNIPANEYDAYSVMLHEVLHALGFYSLIGANGTSFFGAANNYYSRYDQYLFDPSGNRLITSSTATSCPCNNLTFTLNPSVLSTATSGCIADVTTCSIAVQYSSTNVHTKVYTPDCFAQSSSLSHFEDMCPFAPTVDLGCATNPNPALNNNLYYVMSNAIGTGSCYVKRHPKEEERQVLCDIGYSVNPIYSSTVAGAGYTYSAGACNGPNIWGVNDGLVNGIYTYTAAGGANAQISISLASVISNDSPNTASISCLDLITGSVTWAVSGGNLTFTANPGYTGPVIFRYMPQTNGPSGVASSFGGPTYIFAYFVPGNCPPTSCDMVSNGDLESYSTGFLLPACGWPECWRNHTLSADPWRRGCNLSFSEPGDTHNGSPNDFMVGMQVTSNYEERYMNSLSSPLVPGQVYNLGLFVYHAAPSPTQAPLVVAINSTPQFISGASYSLITNFTVMPVNTWTYCTTTFTFNGGLNHNAIIISGNYQASILSGGAPFTALESLYIDDISILPVNSPTFLIPGGNLCGNSTFTDLAQYATAIPGTFSGSFVTSYTNASGTVYDFNALGTAPPGVYSIAFNYTALGCPKSIWQTVIVQPQQTLAVSGSSVICFNSFTPVSITASLSCTSCTNAIKYRWFPGNTIGASQTVTPNSTTIYTVSAFNGSCTVTQTLAVVVSVPTATFATSSSTLCTGHAATLTASGPFTSAIWSPGSIPNPAVVNPTVSSTYSCITTNSAGCVLTQTLSVAVFTNCCRTNTYSVFTASSVPTSVLNGPLRVLNSFTVQAAQKLSLAGSEFLFDPGVKITVSPGSTLEIKDSHLYSCSDMWQGIEVLDGGCVISKRENTDNLIEDAVTAIDLLPKTTGANALDVSNTTFNKNYIAINIGNYTGTTSPYPFSIVANVFTCRDLPFTSSAWPQTGNSSSSSGTGGDLRYVNVALTPTTGLVPPYLNQSTYTITNLKTPYTSQPSHIAIQLNTVGVISTGTTGAYDFVIGTNGAGNFNLFDTHGQFISANNSNVKLINNVFQNTQSYTVATGTLTSTFGGGAVVHRTNGVQNTELMMLAPNINEGNRFWNCHRGIEGKDIYRFWIENAIFRSNQSSLVAVPGFSPTGIQITTNRFEYYINANEFSNLERGINIPIASGQYSVPAGYPLPPTPFYNPGIFADRLRIHQNRFIGNAGNTEFMSDAITIMGVNNVYWYGAVDNTVDPTPKAVAITSNMLNQVYRGINVNGITAFPVFIDKNTVEIKDNGSSQYAIKLTNTTPGMIGFVGGFMYGKATVAQNTASFSSVPTNTNSPLVFLGHNGLSNNSPSVTCNALLQGSQGFVFDGAQANALWMGNTMSPLNQGLILSNNGRMGTQGGSSFASSNKWDGAWGAGNYHTFVDNWSNAAFSRLYVANATGFIPFNNNGPTPQNSYSLSNIFPVSSSAGGYNCYGIPNSRPISPPQNTDGFLSEDLFYIEQMDFYKYMVGNDSVIAACAACGDFYSANHTTSIGKFYDIELYLYQQKYDSARMILDELGGSSNTIEANYKNYYNLYAKYLENGVLTDEDKNALYTLGMLCPGTNGRVIYQSRALYNYLYQEFLNPDCGSTVDDARFAGKRMPSVATQWNVELYPNPTEGLLHIKTGKESERLHVIVKDLSGRIVMKKDVEVKDFIANLEIELINGAYLIYIANGQQAIARKLLISK